ncbi:MAG: hypothetical protein ACE145_15290 [Terriglobia bacterium]
MSFFRGTFKAGRLQAELGAYKEELTSRLAINKSEVISAALSMVEKAQDHLEKRKVDLAWLTYDAARRIEIESYNERRLALHAAALLEESGKLRSKWRRNSIRKLLAKPAELNLDAVRKAMEIRDQDLENTHFKVSYFASKLQNLGVLAGAFVAMTVILAYNGAFTTHLEPGDWLRFTAVICYGALGATVSTMLSLTPKGIEPRIPVQMIIGAMAQARPVLGAAAALAVDAFWRLGIININAPSGLDYTAISFAAGFSDRLLLSAIDKILGAKPASGDQRESEEPPEKRKEITPPPGIAPRDDVKTEDMKSAAEPSPAA